MVLSRITAHAAALITAFTLPVQLQALDSPYLGLSPSPLADNSAVFGNPAGMKPAFGSALTGALSMEDYSSFSSFRLSQQFNRFGYGYRFSNLKNRSEITLAFAHLIFPGLQVGSRGAYFIQDGPNSGNLDFGLQFSPFSWFRAGYYTQGLWQTEKSHTRGQTAAAGIRPFWFLPTYGSRLTAAYEITAPGFNNRAWKETGQAVALYAGLFKYVSLQGRFNLEETENFSLGLSLQMTPNQLLGYHQTAVPGGADHSEYVLQLNTRPKKGFLSLPGKVVVLNLNRQIVEGSITDDWFSPSKRLGHRDLLMQIRQISQTPGIALVIIKTGNIRCGWAVAAEIREALSALPKQGIKTLAYMESASSLSYYIATAASKVAVQPSGYFHVKGFNSEVLFYKGLMDKLGVEAQFIRRGKYKSFQEVFTRESMSEEWKQNMEETLNSLWTHFLLATAKSRGFTGDSMGKLLARPDISPVSARKLGLIDTLIFEDQLKAYGGQKDGGKIHLSEKAPINPDWHEATEIAVITLEGAITSGKSQNKGMFFSRTAGSETLTARLRQARLNSNIKGLLLRINSGGGSAIASDVILRELNLLKKAGKPVLVSIGNVCASGAYYIASAADAIIARENAVLGSIGVFAGKVVLKDLYEKLGITRELVTTAPYADANSNARQWDSTEVSAIRAFLDEFYERFTGFVVEGRNLDRDSVEVLSQGRIFTGEQAVSNGLADKIGGFETAVEMMRKKLGLRKGVEHRLVDLDNENWTLTASLKNSQVFLGKSIREEWDSMKSELFHTWIWALSPEAMVLAGME